MAALDLKSFLMKHISVTRILILVLGCAAISVYLAFQMNSECVTLCANVSPRGKADEYAARLHAALSSSVSSITPNHGNSELSNTQRDYHREESRRRVVTTTTAQVITTTTVARRDETHLKNPTVKIPVTSRRQSFPQLHAVASFDRKCTLPLFCSAKLVRHCVTDKIIGHVPDDLRSERMQQPKSRSVETSHMRQQSFKMVFDSRAWGHSWDVQHQGLNASGIGATLPWTQEATATLHNVINQLKRLLGLERVRILDVPCGDMAWMSRFLQTRDDVDYTGVDIVPSIIRHHKQKFASFHWQFHEWDVVRDGLEFTNASFDLILCRAMLQHLYAADVLRTLAHFSDAPFKYRQRVFLLTTSFSTHPQNDELEINDNNRGRYRRLNLELPPISLVPPLCLVRDGPPDAREAWVMFLGLWELPLHRVPQCWPFAMFPLINSGQSLTSCVDWSLKSRI